MVKQRLLRATYKMWCLKKKPWEVSQGFNISSEAHCDTSGNFRLTEDAFRNRTAFGCQHYKVAAFSKFGKINTSIGMIDGEKLLAVNRVHGNVFHTFCIDNIQDSISCKLRGIHGRSHT